MVRKWNLGRKCMLNLDRKCMLKLVGKIRVGRMKSSWEKEHGI